VTSEGYEATVNIESDYDAGAALFVFTIDGELLSAPYVTGAASSMDIEHSLDGKELRVFVYNIGEEKIAAGSGPIVSIPVSGTIKLTKTEMADYYGNPLEVSTRSLPSRLTVVNYPNPFNPSTEIELTLPASSDYSLRIFNVSGQLVREFSGHADAGVVQITWDGSDIHGNQVASGIYLYSAQAGADKVTRKMVLMK
jgi:hypothetical protein